MDWILDGVTNLTSIMERHKWQRYESRDAMIADGLTRDDAEMLTDFLIATEAGVRDVEPSDVLDDAMWHRLSVR
jgi:hypothetical protein